LDQGTQALDQEFPERVGGFEQEEYHVIDVRPLNPSSGDRDRNFIQGIGNKGGSSSSSSSSNSYYNNNNNRQPRKYFKFSPLNFKI
jgi:general stress protein YciG